MRKKSSLGRTMVAFSAAALFVLLWSVPAFAAPVRRAQPATGTPHKIIDVFGKHYRPKVFLFMGRPNLNLDWSLDDPRFKRSFLERTLDSVWAKPL